MSDTQTKQRKIEALKAGYSMFDRDNEYDAKAAVDVYATAAIDAYRIGRTVAYKAGEHTGPITVRAMEITTL